MRLASWVAGWMCVDCVQRGRGVDEVVDGIGVCTAWSRMLLNSTGVEILAVKGRATGLVSVG